jgi:hypothetical protein
MPAKSTMRRAVPTERKSRFSTAVNQEALDFIQAIETYKHKKGRAFPSWTEILLIAKALGYRRVAEPTPLPTGPDDSSED